MEHIYRNRLAFTWNQRIALSSFFYNLGTDRPEMISALKSQDQNLETLWKKYVSPGSIYEKETSLRMVKIYITIILFFMSNPHTCRDCGCTNENACQGGCTWAEYDLCSNCKIKEILEKNGIADLRKFLEWEFE